MGLFGSIWNGIKEVATKAVKIVKTVNNVVKKVVDCAEDILKIGDGKKIEKVTDRIEETAKQPQIIIIRDSENTVDIGDRAMRAEKKQKEFDDTNKYIDYLRENIKATPKEELEVLPPEERLARKAIGSALLSKAISEKKSLEIPVEFWKEAVNLGLDAKTIDTFLTKFKNAGIAPSEFLKYLKREVDSKEESKVDSALIEAYKELEPEANIKDIEEKVVRMQGK